MPNKKNCSSGQNGKCIQFFDEKTNIQLPIDSKFVTKRVTQKGLEHGPDGELWSILIRLINGRGKQYREKSSTSYHTWRVLAHHRSNKTYKLFHHMPENSSTDVVAEEATKRVAKTFALVQIDIWAKREMVGDMKELDELLEPAEISTLFPIENLVGETASTRRILVNAKHAMCIVIESN